MNIQSDFNLNLLYYVRHNHICTQIYNENLELHQYNGYFHSFYHEILSVPHGQDLYGEKTYTPITLTG